MSDLTWGNQFDGGDDDVDDEQDYSSRWQTVARDGLIMLIDCTTSMFVCDDDDESPFDLCIKCAKNMMQNKIISSDRDLMGIVFFGTENLKNSSDFKHIYILQDLNQPSAERVLQLEEIMSYQPEDFKKEYGHNAGFSLSDALWTCSNLFSNCSHKLGYKRVMLFTNNDNPHSENNSLRNQAIRKAKDLYETGIQLDLMHMQKPGQTFDVTAFYKDCLFSNDDEITALPDPAEQFEELLTRVRSKDHKKRTSGKVNFSFGNGVDMAVGIYNLVRQCSRPYGVKLYKRTNEEIRTNSKTFLKETCEILMPQDLKKAATYGGKKICFEKNEINEIKTFGKTGITLLGFKPHSYLKRHHHVKPAQFIYPEETVIKGSTTMFSALLQKTLEKNVIAICLYTPRKNTPPKFVALLPQAEELDDQRVQITPPGFHVIFLPFADDLRTLKFEEMPRANTEQIEKAKDVIKKLSFKFSSDEFENPALQKYYANLEALALERDEPEPTDDLTIPNHEQMMKRAGKVIKEFEDLVFPDGYKDGKSAAKRKAPATGNAAKRTKNDGDEVDIDIEKEAKAGQLNKLTVPVLKACIGQMKIKMKGTKKADLIDSINKHFGL
ncbi:X-ray repair cross-complementing protein 5-like [Tubulanus polymorphus]|uniref:X-ray repair cross-complementing protein 5-like n=1 Tax=Tubulanus polymorphus TaxID=672921 RepID=UPI003DA4E6A7